jgi:hypothetical protein
MKGVIEIITTKKKTDDTSIEVKIKGTDTTIKPDPGNKVFDKVEIEPSFPGGVTKWKQYLSVNADATIPVTNGAPKGVYTVIVQFIVHTDGFISDVKALTKHGYGMEEEAIRLIAKGPKWVPAVQNGHVVTAYRKQAITFSVQEEVPAVTVSTLVKNTLYIGIDNPVTLITSDIPVAGLTLHADQGVITKTGAGKYVINGLKQTGEAALWVTDAEGTTWGKYYMKVDNIPDVVTDKAPPLLKITVSELKKSDVFQLLQIDRSTEIVSFEFTIDLDNGDISSSTNQGNAFNQKTKNLIAGATAGKMVTIDAIRVKTEGRLMKIPSKAYSIVAD